MRNLLLIIGMLFSLSMLAQTQHQNRKFETTISTIAYTNPSEQVGIDVTAFVTVQFEFENDIPKVLASVKLEKGDVIYFNGNQYSRKEIGEKAYNQIETRSSVLTYDLYYNNKLVKTIGYNCTQDLKEQKRGYWVIFESCLPGDKFIDPDLAKAILHSNDYKVTNMRLSKVRSANYHLVEVYHSSLE